MNKKVIFGALAVVSISATAIYLLSPKLGLAVPDAQAATQTSPSVVAIVNNEPIYQAELMALVQSGVDRSNAIDRRISQVVMSQQAIKEYGDDAKAALAAVKNDVTSQLYISKKQAEYLKLVSDKDIAEFYEKNLQPELFKRVKVKAYLSVDAKDAQSIYEQVKSAEGKKLSDDVSAKFQYLNKEGDHFMGVGQLPYNLGQVFKKMKTGDVMQPVVIREGILVAFLEEAKDQDRPPLEKVKDEIRQQLVAQRLDKDIQQLRTSAKIELKS